ncbi:hypothetical protein WN71_020000 [Streptomyces mangrovisoli]|uniref:Restriction endonuclease subunit S n=1 Tax=Streptomyces mangrovisoli TaxID=1428628 RepID=A0A1J4NUN8_9ACTN|nr:hypothetical protein WN71_020000 [Streptomyces mangrovisoli]
MPPKAAQRDLVKLIESRLAEAETAAEVAQGVYEQGVTLRKALLNAAFTGSLVPQDPDDEPASAVLDRLRALQTVSAKPTGRKREPGTTSQAAPQTSGRLVSPGVQEALPL